MTSLFDRLDLASDAVFLLWFAVGMVAIGLAIGAYMVARRVWRWAGRRKRRVAYRDIEELVARIKAQPVYTGPVYWPAMDRLRELWIEREEKEANDANMENNVRCAGMFKNATDG